MVLKCVILTTLVLAILVAFALLALFLGTRITLPKESPTKPKTPISPELEKVEPGGVIQIIPEGVPIPVDVVEEIEEGEDLKKKTPKPVIPVRVGKLDLELDVNLPTIDHNTYMAGKHTMIVSKVESPEGTCIYNHYCNTGYYSLASLIFCGKRYVTPETGDILFLTAYSLKSEPSFIYYVSYKPEKGDRVFMENTGNEFVVCNRPKDLKGAMEKKGLDLGILGPKVPGPYPVATEFTGLGTTPGSDQIKPTVQMEFDLGLKKEFKVGTDIVKMARATEFSGKFDVYIFSIDGKTITPTKFTVGDTDQSNITTEYGFDAIKVYYPRGSEGLPLAVNLVFSGKDNIHINNGSDSWLSIFSANVEEMLDLVDSNLNNRVVLNLSRRSDYFRSGKGSSSIEVYKDVNVYVEPDKPFDGYTRYKHDLESGGKHVDFKVTKFMFGDEKVMDGNSEELEYVEVITRGNETMKTKPICFVIKPKGKLTKYYMFKGDKYELDSSITESNLKDKLQPPQSPH